MDEIKLIFPQIDSMRIYNGQLLQALDDKISKKWHCDQTVGEVFLKLFVFLKPPYTNYIAQFPEILVNLKSVSKRVAVSHYFQKCKSNPQCENLDLQALISMPFQRIPRYVLLLKEMLKLTSKSHKDYEYLQHAIVKMEDIAKSANERLRDEEKSRAVIDVCKRLDPPVMNLSKPYRRLVREGDLLLQSNDPSSETSVKSTKACRVYLFNDCMLITEPVKGSMFSQKFCPVAIFALKNSMVLDFREHRTDATSSHEFRVHTLNGNLIFGASTISEKDAWISDLISSINGLIERDLSYHPRWKRKSLAFGITRQPQKIVPAQDATISQSGISETTATQKSPRRIQTAPQLTTEILKLENPSNQLPNSRSTMDTLPQITEAKVNAESDVANAQQEKLESAVVAPLARTLSSDSLVSTKNKKEYCVPRSHSDSDLTNIAAR